MTITISIRRRCASDGGVLGTLMACVGSGDARGGDILSGRQISKIGTAKREVERFMFRQFGRKLDIQWELPQDIQLQIPQE